MLCIKDRETLQEVRRACGYLFSSAHAQDQRFLNNLDSFLVKKAYRTKVKLYHPDSHSHESPHLVQRRHARFHQIQHSYQYLISLLKERVPGKLIAIGGAKGGIGKSIVAANLGVLLSSRGFTTVLVDLDLGGANLHLYVGETYLPKKINDFINRKVSTLQEAILETRYGPRLLGADSSQLGIANLRFTSKRKLLNAIKSIEADYVIIDLGGDTSYNVLDFFLAADFQVVMTTLDPASYLDAYRFIKVALYRKLHRLGGPETPGKRPSPNGLKHFLFDALLSPNGLRVEDMPELLRRVQEHYPEELTVFENVLSTFTPALVVNKVTRQSHPARTVRHLQKCCRQRLNITLNHLGNISFHAEVEASARKLIPIVVEHPRGVMAREITAITNTLLYR